MLCSQCSQAINGKPVVAGYLSELIYFEGKNTITLEPAQHLNFCSHRCAWDFWTEEHEDSGMSDEETRYHLISEHGLIPPAH